MPRSTKSRRRKAREAADLAGELPAGDEGHLRAVLRSGEPPEMARVGARGNRRVAPHRKARSRRRQAGADGGLVDERRSHERVRSRARLQRARAQAPNRGTGRLPKGSTASSRRRAGGTPSTTKRSFSTILTPRTNADFVRPKANGEVQKDTSIGSLIEVHGDGGRGTNWTDGCVAVTNEDMDFLFQKLAVGSPVVIVGSYESIHEGEGMGEAMKTRDAMAASTGAVEAALPKAAPVPKEWKLDRHRWILGGVGATLVTLLVLFFLSTRLYVYDSLVSIEPSARRVRRLPRKRRCSRKRSRIWTRRPNGPSGASPDWFRHPSSSSSIPRRTSSILMRRDKVLHEALCSTGSGGLLKDPDGERQWVFETPRGNFRVIRKAEDPVWTKPDWAFVEEGKAVPERLVRKAGLRHSRRLRALPRRRVHDSWNALSALPRPGHHSRLHPPGRLRSRARLSLGAGRDPGSDLLRPS